MLNYNPKYIGPSRLTARNFKRNYNPKLISFPTIYIYI